MWKYVLVFGVAVAILVIASVGRIPGTGKQSAISDERRTATAIEHTPKYERLEVISIVKEHIRESCPDPGIYLNGGQFKAKWLFQPRSDDYYERGMREWTVTEEFSGAFWRLYEDTGEIRSIIGGTVDTC